MFEEKLEKIKDEETEKIEEKYEKSKNLLEIFPPKKVSKETGIEYEIIKKIDLIRIKENQIKELKREIYDLDYEIGFQIGVEIGYMETQYEIASNILEDKIPIDEIASTIGLKEEEIKKLP